MYLLVPLCHKHLAFCPCPTLFGVRGCRAAPAVWCANRLRATVAGGAAEVHDFEMSTPSGEDVDKEGTLTKRGRMRKVRWVGGGVVCGLNRRSTVSCTTVVALTISLLVPQSWLQRWFTLAGDRLTYFTKKGGKKKGEVRRFLLL